MIVLFIFGCLLCGFGAIIMITAIPARGWDATWEQMKRDFHTMIHNPRFQISSACFIIGCLLILLCLWLAMP